jgi:Leucine-rich repeat (LRR) protein
MRSLKHLDLSFNKLKGKIPHGLGSITSLIDLRLSNNHFSGGFPVSFEGLPNLQTLLLDNNAIGGTLPASIAKMPSLVTLRIHENDLMGNLPDFSDAVYLEEAHLDENDFSGTLPNFGSVRLRSLYLGRNAFTGPIPDSFGELSKLEDLYIQANHLTGPIPVSISKLTALQQLDLSFNRLTGPIPQSLAELMQLREFVINDNRLTGNLPDLGSMKRIEIARLNNNLLSGDLKFSLKVGDLNYLKELSFQNNELNGVVPGEDLRLLFVYRISHLTVHSYAKQRIHLRPHAECFDCRLLGSFISSGLPLLFSLLLKLKCTGNNPHRSEIQTNLVMHL